ncbi:MAG: superoxide dismutase [Ni] [Thermodesulfobacteriota bacterium]
MGRIGIVFGMAWALAIGLTGAAWAHCEIPCGIYGDEIRFNLLAEHLTTIEKAMGQIQELEKAEGGNSNQLIRWVVNKEEHATAFQEIASQYFLTQRIKPDMPQYERQLALLHGMLAGAMKCKQTTDPAAVTSLRALLQEFQTLYLGKAGK